MMKFNKKTKCNQTRGCGGLQQRRLLQGCLLCFLLTTCLIVPPAPTPPFSGLFVFPLTFGVDHFRWSVFKSQDPLGVCLHSLLSFLPESFLLCYLSSVVVKCRFASFFMSSSMQVCFQLAVRMRTGI